ncbi:hypothetical protein G7072_04675 [Nocardioides sp. HDW12B]|uniref:hypothetical protein n=1 Tax=Nocardioides sp. HDW12B TaxID=2714939 RepID=UPI00140BEEF5|nr:hypothetical protein [Nocardioides sp. HDW12B]QIK65729.1 hypothetical protein G7072_04675 [Nocardioides sp. HDW12B]
MNDSSDGRDGTLPDELERLAHLAVTFLDHERRVRVAVLDAVDAGHSLEAVSEATRLPLALLQYWTGAEPGYDTRDLPPGGQSEASDLAGRTGSGGNELSDQRRLRTGSLSQRVAAAESKQARADHGGPDHAP